MRSNGGVKRQEIVEKVLGGYGTIGNDVPISPSQQFYNDTLPQREYDPEKASGTSSKLV